MSGVPDIDALPALLRERFPVPLDRLPRIARPSCGAVLEATVRQACGIVHAAAEGWQSGRLRRT